MCPIRERCGPKKGHEASLPRQASVSRERFKPPQVSPWKWTTKELDQPLPRNGANSMHTETLRRSYIGSATTARPCFVL